MGLFISRHEIDYDRCRADSRPLSSLFDRDMVITGDPTLEPGAGIGGEIRTAAGNRGPKEEREMPPSSFSAAAFATDE